MNPLLLAELAAKNGSDIEAIVSAIGIKTLLSLAPHFMAIIATVQAAQAQQPK